MNGGQMTASQHLLRNLFWLAMVALLTGSCLDRSIKTSTVEGVMQDSTGTPLPKVNLTFSGLKDGGPLVSPTATGEYTVTTDDKGQFKRTLRWDNGTDSYSIIIDPSLDYEIYDCPPLQNAPLRFECSLSYPYPISTTSVVVRVRKRH
ncbi:hypothetical protein GCM10027592_22710 [Spirosoma flavus]